MVGSNIGMIRQGCRTTPIDYSDVYSANYSTAAAQAEYSELRQMTA
ncbi:hypothetical protein [Paenibacillus vulneris]|uniref:Uncharacterized protein n=1 Tax=Paenibacillus vulneris TaxID=1133364 RepID=A0ABW3UVG4_9BACL